MLWSVQLRTTTSSARTAERDDAMALAERLGKSWDRRWAAAGALSACARNDAAAIASSVWVHGGPEGLFSLYSTGIYIESRHARHLVLIASASPGPRACSKIEHSSRPPGPREIKQQYPQLVWSSSFSSRTLPRLVFLVFFRSKSQRVVHSKRGTSSSAAQRRHTHAKASLIFTDAGSKAVHIYVGSKFFFTTLDLCFLLFSFFATRVY